MIEFRLNKPTQRGLIIVLFLVVLTMGVALRLSNLDVSYRSPDERFYNFYAKAIAQQGTKETKILVQAYNSDEKLWEFPPPTRIGYIYLVSAVMKTVNSTDMIVGVYVSCVCSIISLLILTLIGLRFFNKWITLCSLLFLSVSPMDLAIMRRFWPDGLLACVGLLLIYFCCEISINSKCKIWYFLLWIFGLYCLLIKESALLVYSLCVLWLLWLFLFKEKSLRKSLILIMFAFMGIIVAILVLANVSGGITYFIEVVRHIMSSVATNKYAAIFQTGPWYCFLQTFWILTPFGATLCLFGIMGTILFSSLSRPLLVLKEKNLVICFWIIFFIIAFMSVATIPRYSKNLRYITAIFGPLYLMSGLGLWHILTFIKCRLEKTTFRVIAAGIMVLVLISAFSDYLTFKYIFTKNGTVDLSYGSIAVYK